MGAFVFRSETEEKRLSRRGVGTDFVWGEKGQLAPAFFWIPARTQPGLS